MIYQTFAQIYDDLMDKDLYHQWLDYTNDHIPASADILELGCGAGHISLALDQKGHRVTGLDISEDMLIIARSYQISADSHYLLVQGDMTDLEGFPMYDAAICYCDSLCYLPREQDFIQTFRQVHQHLDADGIFLFDVHTPYRIKQFEDFSYHAEQEGIVLLWDSYLPDQSNSVVHELSIFQTHDGENYKRFDETHIQRTFSLDQYLKMLQVSGFSDIEVSADFGQEVTEKSERWFFKAKKLG